MAIKSGVYFIQNAGTGTVLDLPNGDSANGTKVRGYEKHKLGDSWVSAQLWIVCQLGDDPVYSIQNARSRTYLNLTSDGPTNGTPITGFESTGDSHQHWEIYRNNADTGYVIENKATTTYVDLKGGKSDNGTLVQNWAGDGVQTTNKNQLWKFVVPA
ncbi:hypothetical protein FOMPIDRAFT_1046850 [Fomitopsis schrenkii]|uniref:Ricin B lectin domain-containing protein n=1 Tax=Fomitopsis schrenkii TaxID=2126942 RepID=S8FPV4_FOMSC|nr:hypothetical protein FOMPIDRAFT_1046850 [Fomitopsis schrenkii]